jgi:GNAT superfamily N-acetyltransferase
MSFEIVTAADRPDLSDAAAAAFRERWPEFIFHDKVSNQYSPRVESLFSQFEILLLHDGQVAAGGWGVPFLWDETPDGLPEGYRSTLVAAVEGHERGQVANTFSFMAAAVAKQFDKQGLATQVLDALTSRARDAGLEHVVAPIRPSWKHRYPNVSMAEYVTWARDDGFAIDPWVRTHQRMGATVIKPAPNSMIVTGTVGEWESWAGMPFPVSGSYIVPDALNLVEVDRDQDLVTYREENLWVQHHGQMTT